MTKPFTQEEINTLHKEYKNIVAKDYNIDNLDISPLMKKMVHQEYGEDDWSNSGYRVRAEAILKNHFPSFK